MRRVFDEHQTRDCRSLDGFWDFAKAEEGAPPATHWHRRFPKTSERMPVPGCWDTKPRHFSYRGTAGYRRTVFVAKAGTAVLTFEAVSGIATVYFDGRKIARHMGSYTPFTALVKDVQPGPHEVIVLVDNAPYPDKVIPATADWHLYGGMFRPVELALLDRVWIRNLRVEYSLRDGRARVEPVVTVRNLGRRDIRDDMVFSLNGKEVSRCQVALQGGAEITVSHRLGEFALPLWSPGHPNLHMIGVEFAGDDLRDRIGFRTVEARRGQILINGQPIRLLGVNRHHEYGDEGFAMSPAIALRDFEIIRDMGCNAVRCHYPMDSYALDLCDEMGLLFWAEIPLWGRVEKEPDLPPLLGHAGTMLTEMIQRDYNHASIFTWSVMNECATDTPHWARAARDLVQLARELDPSRPISYASHTPLKDKGLKHPDIIGVNAYPGWYDDGNCTAGLKARIDGLFARMQKQKITGRPVLITETGGAGLYGDRSLELRKWSERYQTDLIEEAIRFAISRDDLAGIFVWQFSDIRTRASNWWNRPGIINNKGLLDRFRRPKDAFWKVRELFHRHGGGMR